MPVSINFAEYLFSKKIFFCKLNLEKPETKQKHLSNKKQIKANFFYKGKKQ